MKQTDVAKKAELSPSHLSKVLAGESSPSKRALKDLAAVLGRNIRWLESGEGEMRPAVAVAESASLYRTESRSLQAALEPCLAGSALEGALSSPQILSDLEDDRAWRELAEPQKEEARRQLRRFAFTAVAADALGEPFRTRVLDALTIQLINYITAQLRKPD
jgi:transcriptional regulator with XRE-family HTH domain